MCSNIEGGAYGTTAHLYLDYAVGNRELDQLSVRFDLEFFENITSMGVDCSRRDVKNSTDLSVRESISEIAENFHFSFSENLERALKRICSAAFRH